jgi:hypothetical protein
MNATSATKMKDCRATALKTGDANKILHRVITQDVPSEKNMLSATVTNSDAKKNSWRNCENKYSGRTEDKQTQPTNVLPFQPSLPPNADQSASSRQQPKTKSGDGDP